MNYIVAALLVIGASLISGCSSLVSGKVQQFGQDMSSAILESNDPVLVQQGLPTYLLLLDGLVKNQPKNVMLLESAAKLNSAYASAFVIDDVSRARLFNDKAFDYAHKALCLHQTQLCDLQKIPIDELAAHLATAQKKDVSLLFGLGSVWASWIQVHTDDWNAIADLARVKMIMSRIVVLDESYQAGEAHLYLGVLATLLSPALGGQPEVGKVHFEKALALSQQQNLMVKVYYAKFYARSVFERELHDRLLNEVLAANPRVGQFTLGNILAQQQAKTLLSSADDYF